MSEREAEVKALSTSFEDLVLSLSQHVTDLRECCELRGSTGAFVVAPRPFVVFSVLGGRLVSVCGSSWWRVRVRSVGSHRRIATPACKQHGRSRGGHGTAQASAGAREREPDQNRRSVGGPTTNTPPRRMPVCATLPGRRHAIPPAVRELNKLQEQYLDSMANSLPKHLPGQRGGASPVAPRPPPLGERQAPNGPSVWWLEMPSHWLPAK